jgi:transcriptional regulator with XRE-family HTH domain
MPVKIDSDARLAASTQNLSAGRLVRRAREEAEQSQGDFGRALARRLGLIALSQSAVSDWELGKRQVPAAVLIAAAEVARMRPAELFALDAKKESRAERLAREIEGLLGDLTPEQRQRLRAAEGKR